MDDDKSEEQHVIAAAHHLVKALKVRTSLSNEVRRTLADLDIHLAAMTEAKEDETTSLREIEGRFKSAQAKIMTLQSNCLKIWDTGPSDKLLEYLQNVEEIQNIIVSLESMMPNKNRKQNRLTNQAHSVLQIAMIRLQEEVINILAQSKQCFGHAYVSFHSCEEIAVDEETMVSIEDDSVEAISCLDSSRSESEEGIIMDLVHPGVVPHIKSIADLMFTSHYVQEFCQVFIRFWKDALHEYLRLFWMQQISIEDVLRMDWSCLNCRIKKWRQATKNVIAFYLPSEKNLFDQILGEFESVSSTCFIEASKDAMMCLLNFGQAVAIGPLQPERLFCLLDMYELLSGLCQDVDALFCESHGNFIQVEYHELLKNLGDSAKSIFLGLGNRIASNTSTTPFQGGGVHPLTKYVINYFMLLSEYYVTLRFLLEDRVVENSGGVVDALVRLDISSEFPCPLALHLKSIASMLESNLEHRSNLYKDDSLKHIFLMNNIHYMVQKIKKSKLRTCFGDEWIKEHIVKYVQHEKSYERKTWNSILSLITGYEKSGKAVLKERCRNFSIAFEDVYKNQTGWIIPDIELRDDLNISIALRVVHAYRTFVGQVRKSLSDKHIKYTEEDVEQYLLDFFQGSAKSLNHHWRR
ncbi:exocyst complex component EXO70E2-like [Solanum dulcamara]|uniref:exocyst complex component EXO70E2-like n=1 Tax=Solanum dulcamara TaxID=45834 RepID=UPI0024864782|nr:exocyst complex component EXO70E2-like [Solanum dulcamara]XP_055827815.1 exocyst complex component EXO70E2-like [Solanum dulcamara]